MTASLEGGPLLLPARPHQARAKLLLRKPIAIVFNEHTHEDGAVVFRHACELRARWHCVQAADRALPVRAVTGLAQGQEPGQPSDAAGAGWTVVNGIDFSSPHSYKSPVRLRPHLTFTGGIHEGCTRTNRNHA